MTDESMSAVADAVEGLQIDGPTREPDALEQQMSDEVGGEVRIDGPGGTTGAEAVAAVVGKSGELFDAHAYLEVPEVDGMSTDKLTIAFGGSISYESSDADGRALFDALALGKNVELRVSGVVATKQGAYKENTDGESTVTGKAGVKIDTFYFLKPEDLV